MTIQKYVAISLRMFISDGIRPTKGNHARVTTDEAGDEVLVTQVRCLAVCIAVWRVCERRKRHTD